MDNKKIPKGIDTVRELYGLPMLGHITPFTWYKKITFANGKPDFVAIAILSDIVYWYKPMMVHDEAKNEVKLTKKFKSDLLQRSYKQIEDMFSFTYREAHRALVSLEEMGLVKRVFRTINGPDGTKISNVMFIALYAENVKKITTLEIDENDPEGGENTSFLDVDNRGGPTPGCRRGPTPGCRTYTDTTYTKITYKKEKQIKRKDVDNFSKPREESGSLRPKTLPKMHQTHPPHKPREQRSGSGRKGFNDFSDKTNYSYDLNSTFYDEDKNLNRDLYETIRYESSRYDLSYNYLNKLVKKFAHEQPNMTFPCQKAFTAYMTKAISGDRNNLADPLYQSTSYTPKRLLSLKSAYVNAHSDERPIARQPIDLPDDFPNMSHNYAQHLNGLMSETLTKTRLL